MNDYYSGISNHHPIHDRRQKLTPCCLVETPAPSTARVILCNKGYKCLSASLSVCFYLSSWRNWINVQWISRSLCRRCICCCFIVWVWMSVTEPKKRRKLEWTSQQPLLLLNTWPKWIQLFHFFAHLLAGFFFCMWLIASIYVYTLLIWCCCYVCCCFVCMRECVSNLRSKH